MGQQRAAYPVTHRRPADRYVVLAGMICLTSGHVEDDLVALDLTYPTVSHGDIPRHAPIDHEVSVADLLYLPHTVFIVANNVHSDLHARTVDRGRGLLEGRRSRCGRVCDRTTSWASRLTVPAARPVGICS